MKLINDSLECIGYKSTRDLEIDDKNHNFLIEGNIVTSNSHSFFYSLNAYISMWLKVYYKKEYYVSLLNNSNPTDVATFIKQAKLEGIKFYDLLCNKVDRVYSIDYDTNTIRMSLSSIKGIASKDIDKILPHKVEDLMGLLKFIKEEKIGKRSIEPLCRLGFFKEIFPNSKGLENLILTYRTLKEKEKHKLPELIEEAKNVTDYNLTEEFYWQRHYLNFYLFEHPFETNIKIIQKVQPDILNLVMTPQKLDSNVEDGNYLVCGILNDIIKKKSKTSKKEYYKLVIEDNVKQVNILVWNVEDIVKIKKGDFIFIKVSKNNFGLTKDRKISIKIFENEQK